jgi:quercetin dioxygenase-like cupin family protein
MKRISIVAIVLFVVPLFAIADEMISMQAGKVKWGPAPPVLKKGAMAAVMSGDPSKEGPFVMRLKFPAGYRVYPHWHPTDEHVTVISGKMNLAMGDSFDKSKGRSYGAGGYAMLPAQMHHYAWASVDSVVQIHGMGPFVLNYVNAADDPSKPK